MGIKISEMTTTGSAPADSYIPLAHNGENYKIKPGIMRGVGGVGEYVDAETAWPSNVNVAKIEIGDLGPESSIDIAIATEFEANGGNLGGQRMTCIVKGTLFGIPFLDLGTTTTCFTGTIFGNYMNSSAVKQAESVNLAGGNSVTEEGGNFQAGGSSTYSHFLIVEGTKIYLSMGHYSSYTAGTIWSKSLHGVTIVFT